MGLTFTFPSSVSPFSPSFSSSRELSGERGIEKKHLELPPNDSSRQNYQETYSKRGVRGRFFFLSWEYLSPFSIACIFILNLRECFATVFCVCSAGYPGLAAWPAPRSGSRDSPPAASSSAPHSACTPSESGSWPRAVQKQTQTPTSNHKGWHGTQP